MDFVAYLPIDSVSHYGIFGYSSQSDTWALAHWRPVLAGRDSDTGWQLDHPSRNGDPIFTDTALYDVTVESGPDWRLATTGVQFGDTVETGAGMIARRFVSGPVRDFTIVADEDFEVIATEVDGITINSWFNPGQDEVGEVVAQYCAQSVEIFGETLSPYPYLEMDLVPVDMHGAAGAEFPQLMYLGLNYYTSSTDHSTPNDLDLTVAHEVIHQWFYALVGNNQYTHAYIDEGITNYLAAEVYFQQAYGEDAAGEVVEAYLREPFERIVGNDGDVVVDQPTDEFETGRDYVFAAYIKAPLGFEAIRLEIGDEAFFGALRAYVEDFMFDVAEPDDLLTAFEQSSDVELQDLWDHWFTEPAGDEAVE
jgi:aminopeptidase N